MEANTCRCSRIDRGGVDGVPRPCSDPAVAVKGIEGIKRFSPEMGEGVGFMVVVCDCALCDR